ncbi:MAG: hypothetical protein IPP14_04675 [Planctomycetes bacterium]|nr:hypothetical protein [Planctomycetota bacterium]
MLSRYKETRVEYENAPLGANDTLKVGDIVTVYLDVSANAGDRYLCIEGARPSCLEPISSRFDDPKKPGLLKVLGGLAVTKEERDTSTNFYIPELGRDGRVSFRYECVVVAAGQFTSLPARAFDMYDESRQGHSASDTLTVK